MALSSWTLYKVTAVKAPSAFVQILQRHYFIMFYYVAKGGGKVHSV
jgi:hypothetical protein